MPRFSSNRWWTFILTIVALQLASLSLAARLSADPIRESDRYTGGSVDGTGGGGLPPPTGAGDPDQPVNTRLKVYQRGSLSWGGAELSSRSAGDRRVGSDVWMVRLLVMQRVFRSYWFRY